MGLCLRILLVSTALAVPADAMPPDLPICKALVLRDTARTLESMEGTVDEHGKPQPGHLERYVTPFKAGTIMDDMLDPIYWVNKRTGLSEYCMPYNQGCVPAHDVRLLDCQVVKKHIVGRDGERVGFLVECRGCKHNQ